ncbi:MAG: glucose-6-phosphate isomerase, partial [Pseudomonadota bacterium]
MTDPAEAWTALEPHGARLRARHLRALFEDPRRFTALSARLDDLVIDFSKEKLDQEALAALVTLARAVGVQARRDAMARGARINTTEDRAVLHMALRGGAAKDATVDGQEVMPEVLTER